MGHANYTLQCPHCGSDYLHQRCVTVYERKEDAPLTIKTEVSRSGANVMTVPSESSGNPSSRRHGLSIVFECEGCPYRPELTFEQHKGVTVVEWRNAPAGTHPPILTDGYSYSA